VVVCEPTDEAEIAFPGWFAVDVADKVAGKSVVMDADVLQ